MPDYEDYDAGDWDDENDEFDGFEIYDVINDDLNDDDEIDRILPVLEKHGFSYDSDIDFDEMDLFAGKRDPRWTITADPFAVFHACRENFSDALASNDGSDTYVCPACYAEIEEKDVLEFVEVLSAEEVKRKPTRTQPRTGARQVEAPSKSLREPSKRTSARNWVQRKAAKESAAPAAKSKIDIPQKQTADPSEAKEDSLPSTITPPKTSKKGRRTGHALREVAHALGVGKMETTQLDPQQSHPVLTPDPLLYYLLWLAEVGARISITINNRGQFISGMLASPSQFFSTLEGLVEQAESDDGNSKEHDTFSLHSILAEQVQIEKDQATRSLTEVVLAIRRGRELPDIGIPPFIHLLDVTIDFGGELTSLPAWRGRVSAIDGYTLGRLLPNKGNEGELNA